MGGTYYYIITSQLASSSSLALSFSTFHNGHFLFLSKLFRHCSTCVYAALCLSFYLDHNVLGREIAMQLKPETKEKSYSIYLGESDILLVDHACIHVCLLYAGQTTVAEANIDQAGLLYDCWHVYFLYSSGDTGTDKHAAVYGYIPVLYVCNSILVSFRCFFSIFTEPKM